MRGMWKRKRRNVGGETILSTLQMSAADDKADTEK
jgi:hypothetical protein